MVLREKRASPGRVNDDPTNKLVRFQIEEELTMYLSWSGVIVRNFDFRFSTRTAMIAVVFALLLDTRATFAQARRFGLFNQPRTATNLPNHAQPNQNNQSPQTPVNPAQVNIQFDELLDRAIQITSKRYLTANSHSPWQIFHCVLAMRQDCVLRLGKEKVNAINWISTTEPKFANESWMMLTPHGAKFHPYTQKYYFEGHPAQFLALLTHCDLPPEHEFHVQGKVVKLSDFINNTMKEVNTREEVTWVLWALQHYLQPDAEWVNQANERWSIERLVQLETAAPVVGAPCGGNHRLFALTRARDKYLKTGGRLRGVWLQADQKIRQHIEIARSLQNSDGSFSSESYKGPMHTNDVNLRFNTTGHTMEFLSIALPQERLSEPWVRNAVWMLSRELILHKDTEIDCGPLFHSLDALILYRDRIRPKQSDAAADPSIADAKSPKQSGESSDKYVGLNPDPKKSAESGNASGRINPPNSVALPDLKPGAAPLKPKAVKLDPSQLADIGEPAPSNAPNASKTSPQRIPVKDRNMKGAPGLLPDQAATPLSEPKPGAPAVVEDRKPTAISAPNDASLEIPIPVPDDSDEPVSALEPANL